jgi:hypothetical protein
MGPGAQHTMTEHLKQGIPRHAEGQQGCPGAHHSTRKMEGAGAATLPNYLLPARAVSQGQHAAIRWQQCSLEVLQHNSSSCKSEGATAAAQPGVDASKNNKSLNRSMQHTIDKQLPTTRCC